MCRAEHQLPIVQCSCSSVNIDQLRPSQAGSSRIKRIAEVKKKAKSYTNMNGDAEKRQAMQGPPQYNMDFIQHEST